MSKRLFFFLVFVFSVVFSEGHVFSQTYQQPVQPQPAQMQIPQQQQTQPLYQPQTNPMVANPIAANPTTGTNQPGYAATSPQVIPARPIGAIPGTAPVVSSGMIPPQNPQATPPKQQPQPALLNAPFVLTPEEQNNIEIFLANWEKKTQTIKVFECEFEKLEYQTAITGDSAKPSYRTYGIAKYAAPDKGFYWVQGEINGSNLEKGKREEKTICDGKAFYQFDYTKKEVVEIPIPEESRNRGMGNLDSPIMFVVGAKPQELKERFFLRLFAHPNNPELMVLEAYPKWIEDSKEFRSVQIILYRQTYDPYGMRQYQINGTDATTFLIRNAKINPQTSLVQNVFGGKNEFENVVRSAPSGWTHRVEDFTSQMLAPPAVGSNPGNLKK